MLGLDESVGHDVHRIASAQLPSYLCGMRDHVRKGRGQPDVVVPHLSGQRQVMYSDLIEHLFEAGISQDLTGNLPVPVLLPQSGVAPLVVFETEFEIGTISVESVPAVQYAEGLLLIFFHIPQRPIEVEQQAVVSFHFLIKFAAKIVQS